MITKEDLQKAKEMYEEVAIVVLAKEINSDVKTN